MEGQVRKTQSVLFVHTQCGAHMLDLQARENCFIISKNLNSKNNLVPGDSLYFVD